MLALRSMHGYTTFVTMASCITGTTYVASRTHLEPLPRHASLKEFVHVLVDVHQVPILLRIQLIHPRVHV